MVWFTASRFMDDMAQFKKAIRKEVVLEVEDSLYDVLDAVYDNTTDQCVFCEQLRWDRHKKDCPAGIVVQWLEAVLGE